MLVCVGRLLRKIAFESRESFGLVLGEGVRIKHCFAIGSVETCNLYSKHRVSRCFDAPPLAEHIWRKFKFFAFVALHASRNLVVEGIFDPRDSAAWTCESSHK